MSGHIDLCEVIHVWSLGVYLGCFVILAAGRGIELILPSVNGISVCVACNELDDLLLLLWISTLA